MKKLIAICMVAIIFIGNVFAQTTKDIVTEHYKVDGVCEHCKKRIEEAAYTKGVKHAEWDVKTHELTVTYKPEKTSADVILKHIADAGHDNEKYKAEDKVYNKLPKCCKYKKD